MCFRGTQLEVMLMFVVVVVSSQVQPMCACPKDCFCAPHSKNVQCSNQNLLQIPDGIPNETLELNLNENKFKHPGLGRHNLTDLRDIQNLYLSDTGLETIAVDTFSDLTQLSWLDISKNNIRLLVDFTFRGLHLKHLFINDNPDLELSAGAFAGMTTQGLYMNHCGLRRLSVDLMGPLNGSLKTLWLHGNNFGTLHEKWRYFLRKMAHVRLGGNAFHCNCELSWLHAFYISSKLSLFAGGDQPQCASPPFINGKNFDDLTDEDFRCELPTFQNVDAVFDNKMGKLSCHARGDPAPTLSWVRPNGSTETFYLKPDHVGEQNEALILLTNSKFENKEVYKCVAANPAGNVTFSLNIVWPDTRSLPPVTPKAATKMTKLSKGTTSNILARDEMASVPFQTLQRNYAGDDSQVYDRKSNPERSRMWPAESAPGAADIGQHEKLFGVVDVAGAVVGTFLLTLLVTVTFVHFYCRPRLVAMSDDLNGSPRQSNNKQNVMGVYVMNDTEENCVKMINYRNNTDCPR